MNEINKEKKNYFYDYNEKGDDTKMLTIILLVFAFLLCPIFAFIFKLVGAPIAIFYTIFSATFVFPLILLMEKIIPFLNGKMQYIYFIYFLIITDYIIIDLYYSKFNYLNIIYFIALFSILNFSVQRFKLSLIYFINTLIFLFISINFNNPKTSTIFSLVTCIGIFYLILFYSRDMVINRVKAHNKYIKKIVNNLGKGMVFFKLNKNKLELIDSNTEIKNIIGTSEIETFLIQIISKKDILKLENLELNEQYIKIYNQKNHIEIKFTKIELNKKEYFLAIVQDISQKINENNKVIESEKKYKNIFIRNVNSLFTMNLDGNIIEYNPAFSNLFNNRPLSEINLFVNDEWTILKTEIINKLNITNYKKTIEADTDKPKNLIFNFYYDYENNIIEGNITDNTEANIQTKALLENENKYRVIFEENNDSIVLLDEDRIIDINQQGINLFNKSQNDIEEKSIWDFTYNQSPELKKEYDLIFNKLYRDKQVKFNWLFAKNDSFIEASISIVALKIQDVELYQCVIRDETERNINIREIQQNNKTLESIIENTPEGFVILKKNDCVYANQEFLRIFDLEDCEIKSIQINESFFGLNYPKYEKLLLEHLEDKQIKQKQFNFFIKNKAVNVELTIVSIVYEQEEAILLIMKDVSFQLKLSKEILRAELAEENSKKLQKEIEERKKVEQKLESEYLRTHAIFESSKNTFLVTLNTDLNFTSFNTQSELYFEYQTGSKVVVGASLEKYFEKIISPLKLRYFKYIKSSIRKGKSFQFELKFINIYNEKKWVEIYLNPIFDVNNVLTEISLVAHDTTDKKENEKQILKSLKEKEVLLKEVHHRVKNNLQIISSILNLQSSYIEDTKILEILEESRHRIRSMAIIHENLYQTTNFSSINFQNYSKELISNLIASYQFNKTTQINFIEKTEKVELSLDLAIPAGLIINELITNSMKYAFINAKKGNIYLELFEKNSIITLVVGDNGIGLPENYDIYDSETLGLQLVITLIEQIGGNLRIETKKGIKYFITFEMQKL